MERVDSFQKINQLFQLFCLEHRETLVVPPVGGLIQRTEELEARLRYLAKDLSPISGRAASLQQPTLLQLIDESSNTGRLLHQAGSNLSSRQALFPGSAQNPQDVVLLWGNGALFDQRSPTPA